MADKRFGPRSAEVCARISEGRKGKGVGLGFRGNRELITAARRRRAAVQLAAHPTITCARPQCDVAWRQTSKNPSKRYCSISCARKVDTVLGEISRGRTPPEGSGRCKWYEFHSGINGGAVRVQGSWELRVAHCLETHGLPWRANHGRDRFSYLDAKGVQRSYNPDFWQDGIYIEVKGYADPATRHKLEQIQAQGVPLKVLYWQDIKALETDLFGEPLCGTNATARVIRQLTVGTH